MIKREELIDILDHDVPIRLDDDGNYCRWGTGIIHKANKDPRCGKVEKCLVYIYISDDLNKEFDDYNELLDFKINGISIYDRLKNEDPNELCTRYYDDDPGHGGPRITT